MSHESLDVCRLCSAPDHLICMFTGKQRDVRDSLRKMIKETVNIQMEQNQDILSVCFNCLVDITYFYYFRLQCHQNQSNFKTILASPTAKKQKCNSPSVDQVALPDIDATSHTLEWLLSKRKSVSEYNNYSVQCDKQSQTCNFDSQSQEVQTNVESSEKSIQTENSVILRQQGVQTVHNTKDTSSQTVKMRESLINGTLLAKQKIRPVDKCCQTDFATQEVGKAEKINNVQNKLGPARRKGRPPKNTKNIGTTQTSTQDLDDIFYEHVKHNQIDTECQTDMTLDPTIDNSIASNYILGRDFKSSINDLKMDFKEEKLSPFDHLLNSTPPLSDETKSSPNCSNLLKIHEGKSDPVFTCSSCDKIFYNKRELREHRKTHLICPICKRRFRSFVKTQQHLHDCKVAKLNKSQDLNLNAYVHLMKVEKDSTLMNKFPNMFKECRR